MTNRYLTTFLLLSVYCGMGPLPAFAQGTRITNDTVAKRLTFGNKKMKAVLDYHQQANISSLTVNGQQVIQGPAGIYSIIRTNDATYSTMALAKDPSVKVRDNRITITGIRYGDKNKGIDETWIFTINDTGIRFDMERTLSKGIEADYIASPAIIFSNMDTWTGAFQDYGGLAWFYLFNKRSDTYGVHSHAASFWNSKSGNGLNIDVQAPGNQVAISYSHTAKDELACTIIASPQEMMPRLDSGTNRRRFLRDTVTDVWSPLRINAGRSRQSITLSWFDFNETYGRGKFNGINGEQVSDVLNTIARIGVIDKDHFGGNSWHTPYGPICLHEQYIAQMGLAINDNNYLKGYRQCLDFYRDNAIKPDGRVWPRWAYTNEDAMPGAFTEKGFYEAQWGYLLDANPDLVTNVAELYDLTGDKAWVATHRESCEKALDWILKRDSDNNGLVEMLTDSMQQKRGSDWIDIIWASYENAFVNAKLYHALVLWAAIEEQLEYPEKAKYYLQFAQKLKAAFNRPVSAGGFWDEENKCYIHWREKDASAHGRNMVTPVNFMAIGYGICDDKARIRVILDNIEAQMQKEHLFFWPLCMYSYAKGEGNDWQFPFPNYENGDIFLSWGALGVKAYAAYKPALAIKYVRNVLAQYAKDGLAFQRYGRAKQDGLGDDILSGNSLTIVGLYQSIYGIDPKYNRFYLNPHITEELAGTRLKYDFRGQRLLIGLATNKYTVSNGRFRITAANDFGFNSANDELSYFNGNSEKASLKIMAGNIKDLGIDINGWNRDDLSWNQSSTDPIAGNLVYRLNDLKQDSYYSISINNKKSGRFKTNAAGTLEFTYKTDQRNNEFKVLSE